MCKYHFVRKWNPNVGCQLYKADSQQIRNSHLDPATAQAFTSLEMIFRRSLGGFYVPDSAYGSLTVSIHRADMEGTFFPNPGWQGSAQGCVLIGVKSEGTAASRNGFHLNKGILLLERQFHLGDTRDGCQSAHPKFLGTLIQTLLTHRITFSKAWVWEQFPVSASWETTEAVNISMYFIDTKVV